MSRTIEIPDLGEIGAFLALFALFAFIICAPLVAGYVIWLILSPVGFWQVGGAYIVEIIILGALYTVEILVIAILGALSE